MASTPTADEIVAALQTDPELANEVLGKLSAESPVMDTLVARFKVQAAEAKTEDDRRRAQMHLILAQNYGKIAVCQTWTESERGWGSRPDGYTLHSTLADRDWWVINHNSQLPDDHIPDVYSRTAGSPYLVDIDEQTRGELIGVKGIWGKGNVGPEPSSLSPHDGRAWRPA